MARASPPHSNAKCWRISTAILTHAFTPFYFSTRPLLFLHSPMLTRCEFPRLVSHSVMTVRQADGRVRAPHAAGAAWNAAAEPCNARAVPLLLRSAGGKDGTSTPPECHSAVMSRAAVLTHSVCFRLKIGVSRFITMQIVWIFFGYYDHVKIK